MHGFHVRASLSRRSHCRPKTPLPRLPRHRIKRFLGWWILPSGAGDRFSDAGLFHLLNGEAVVGFIRYLLAERSLAPASVAQAALTIQKGVQWCARRSAALASQPRPIPSLLLKVQIPPRALPRQVP